MKKPRVIHDEWRVLSKKFVQHHRLPFGTKIVLSHGPTERNSGRRARNDLTVARRLFVGRARDAETVNDLFCKYLTPALLVNLADRGLRLQLLGPNAEQPKNNTKVATVRAWPALPTAGEIEEEDARNAEIEEISKLGDLDIRAAEELREDPNLVFRGFVRALIRRYGITAVKDAMAAELGS